MESKEYNDLNKEDIEDILNDLTNSIVDKERKMVIWVNEDNKLVRVEQTKMFNELLKKEVERQCKEYRDKNKK